MLHRLPIYIGFGEVLCFVILPQSRGLDAAVLAEFAALYTGQVVSCIFVTVFLFMSDP